MRVNSLILAVLMAVVGFGSKLSAQPLTTPVNVTPDCLVFFDLTAVSNSAQFDNRFIGCDSWTVDYTNTGFATLSLIFQSSPDNGGAPAGFVNFAGGIVAGVNPNVAITQGSSLFKGFYPWQRIRLDATTGGPGRVRGTFFGYRSSPTAYTIISGLSTVTANQGTPAVQANRWPVQLSDGANPQGLVGNPLYNRLSDGANPQGLVGNPLYNRLSDGANAQGVQANPLFIRLSDGTNPFGTSTNPLYAAASPTCTSKAVVTLTGAGATQVVALSAGKSIKVCHLSLSAESPVNVQVIEGTGANCVTGPANITGLYRSVLGMALDFGVSPLTGSSAQALCISLGTAVNVGGVLTYAQN